MESNQFGKSIVKAAWILSISAIICMVIYVSSKDRYTAVGNMQYIDQKTGIVYSQYQSAKP